MIVGLLKTLSSLVAEGEKHGLPYISVHGLGEILRVSSHIKSAAGTVTIVREICCTVATP